MGEVKSGEPAQPGVQSSCTQSVCERCGEPFSCGAQSTGCWCAEVRLADEVLAGLRERYRGCLCRACLEGFAPDGSGR